MNTLNSTERSDNLFILYCLCLPLLWVKDEETSVWLSTLYNLNGFLVLKGAQCCYGEDILIRSKTESKEKDAHWLILFLNKQNKKTVFVFMTDCLNQSWNTQHRCKLLFFYSVLWTSCFYEISFLNILNINEVIVSNFFSKTTVSIHPFHAWIFK